MAKSSTSFKKGQIGNPNGKPPLPEDLKQLMKTTGEQMRRDICEVYLMPVAQLQRAEELFPDVSAGRAAIMSCLNNSYASGDFKAIHVILDRVLGKVPEAVIEPDDPNSPDTSKDETIRRLVGILEDTKPKTDS